MIRCDRKCVFHLHSWFPLQHKTEETVTIMHSFHVHCHPLRNAEGQQFVWFKRKGLIFISSIQQEWNAHWGSLNSLKSISNLPKWIQGLPERVEASGRRSRAQMKLFHWWICCQATIQSQREVCCYRSEDKVVLVGKGSHHSRLIL